MQTPGKQGYRNPPEPRHLLPAKWDCSPEQTEAVTQRPRGDASHQRHLHKRVALGHVPRHGRTRSVEASPARNLGGREDHERPSQTPRKSQEQSGASTTRRLVLMSTRQLLGLLQVAQLTLLMNFPHHMLTPGSPIIRHFAITNQAPATNFRFTDEVCGIELIHSYRHRSDP